MQFRTLKQILIASSRAAGILALTLAAIFAWNTQAVFGQQTQSSSPLPPLIAAPGYTPPSQRPATTAPQATAIPTTKVVVPTPPPAVENPTPVVSPSSKPAAAAPRKSARIAVKPANSAVAQPTPVQPAPTTPAASQPAPQVSSGGNSFDVATVPSASATSADNSNDQEFPAPAMQPAYRIGVDDILNISVWQEPDLSRTVPVRPDGKISLPLVGDIAAAGKTSMQLQGELKLALSKFVRNPELTVIVADIRSRRINVIGQVSKPGAFPLTQSMGVLEAIAVAGGLRDFAKKKDIYVLRMSPDGKRDRVAYSYEDVLKGKPGSRELMLQPRDTVVVP